MSKDIDYIPKDRSLCKHCIYYEECSYGYACKSLDRLINFEMEKMGL